MITDEPGKRIGVTMGDPSGVGPELCAALIASSEPHDLARVLFFADRPVLQRAFTQRTGGMLPDTVAIIDRGLLGADQAIAGRPSEAGATAQVAYLEAAARSALRGEIAAIVTAPVSKIQCQRAGFEFPGQTEFFSQRLRAAHSAMLFAAPDWRVILATTHVPIARVPQLLTPGRLDEVIDLGVSALRTDFGIDTPNIGVVALNPHAGEAGLLGSEERDLIEPAIHRARQKWAQRARISDPLVPDHAFRQPSLRRFDLLVAMYHDQALIPLKILDFDHTVNLTVGLPIIRTSPDHGVAYDIAGSGSVRPDSFLRAFALAVEMSERRHHHRYAPTEAAPEG